MPTTPQGAASAVSDYFGGNRGKAPEGMSPLFFDEINNSPEAEAIRRSKYSNVGREPRSDAEIRDEIDQLIAKKWAETPPEKQQEYHHQDDIGSKNLPGSAAAQAEKYEVTAKENADLNRADFSKWNEGSFADLQKTAQAAAMGDTAAIDRLKNLVNGIQDPEIQKYVGDYVSQAATAGASQQAIDDQRKEYEKLSGLTDPTMTAAERLMQYEARQKQENDLRAQRGAIENQMQARGLFGSGAEMQMLGQEQQRVAQTRAYDEMQAQANAQNRAMEALKQANTVAGNIRTSEAQESQFRGTAADKASEFNKTLRDAYDKWVTEEQDRQNRAKVDRESTLTNTTLTGNNNAVARAGVVANTGLAGVQAGNVIRDSGLKNIIDTHRNTRDEEEYDKGQKAYGNY